MLKCESYSMARTTLVIPDALWREVKLRAAKENMTISDWVSEAIKGKIQPAVKASSPKPKFDDFWVSKPMGLKIVPFRDQIYDLPAEDGRSWR